MLTVILIALPMVAALLTAFAGSGSAAKKIALAAAIAEFALFLPALLGQVTDLAYSGAWVPSLGINFSVNMHGLSLLMVFLTVALVPLILLSAHRTDYNSRFYALVLLMQAALVGVFTAQDGFLFYIFWELALLPIWFICLVWGDEGRQRITLKFFLFTLFGSLFSSPSTHRGIADARVSGTLASSFISKDNPSHHSVKYLNIDS